LDDIPASVHPTLYKELKEWGFNGFVIADDTGNIRRIAFGVLTADEWSSKVYKSLRRNIELPAPLQMLSGNGSKQVE